MIRYPVLTLLCGPSGSGKSSYIQPLPLPISHLRYSSDEIRKELYGDSSVQKNHDKVFSLLHQRIKQALIDRKSVVYDATNLSKKRRIAFLKDLRGIPCYKECFIFVRPIPTLIKADSERDRTVGEEVILRQLRQFQPPFYDEGWDIIRVVHPDPEELYAHGINDLFWKASTFDQRSRHHSHTLSTHAFATQSKLREKENILGMVGVYHDLGKLFYSLDEKGERCYYGHEGISAYIYLYLSRYRSEGPYDGLAGAYVISLHMRHYSYKDPEKYQLFLRTLPKPIRVRLEDLTRADEDSKS